MTGLAIKLFFSGLWKRLTALFSLALRYPWQAACIALLCLSAGLWRGNVKRDQIIAAKDAEIAQRDKQYAANLAAQIEQKRQWEAKATQAAKEADNAFEQTRPDRRSLIAAHADSVRIDKVCRRDPAPATEAPTAPVDDGSGSMPDMVAVPRDEYETLAENTRRLDWIVNVYVPDLVEKGLAERLPDPGFGGK